MTLDLAGLTGGYGAGAVTRDVTMTVGDGEIVAILGPSGSGKTTLLRMIAGLHVPSAGRVRVGGVDVTDLPAHRRRVGLVPQEGALFPRMSVAENVGYGRGIRRRAIRDPRVVHLLDLVDLAELAQRRPHELSGGQRQRVAVARALAPRPEVLLLDEPFSALDAVLRRSVRDQVADVLRAAAVAAVLITHDRSEAFAVADRVAVFEGGRILQIDSPAALYTRPRSAQVAAATGEVLFLAASARPDGSGLRTAIGDIPLDGGARATRVGLRPDQLRLAAVDGSRPALTVVGRRTVGAQLHLDLRTDGGCALTVTGSVFDDTVAAASVSDRVAVRVLGAPVVVERGGGGPVSATRSQEIPRADGSGEPGAGLSS